MDEASRVGFLVGTVVYTIIFIPFITFYIARRHHQMIASRGWRLSVFQSCWGAFHLFFTFLNASGYVTCFVEYVSGSLLVIFWGGPYIIRALYLWREHGKNLMLLNREGGSMNQSPRLIGLLQKPIIYGKKFEKIFLTSLLTFFVAIFLFLFIIGKDYLQDPNTPAELTCLSNQFYYIIIQSVLVISSTTFCIWLLWDTEDAFYFKTELVICVTIACPLFILYGITMATSLIPYYDSATVVVGFLIFFYFMVTIVFPVVMTNTRAQKSFFVSGRFTRNSSTTSQKDPFSTVFDDKILLDAFKRYAVKTWSVENLLFYLETNEYRMSTPYEKLPEKMKNIWMSFLDSDSVYLINIDENIYNVIKQKVFQETEPDREIFIEAEKQVFDMLKYGPFKSWKETEEYQKLTNSQKIQLEAIVNHRNGKD